MKYTVVLLLAPATIFAGPQAADKKTDLDRLQGHWMMHESTRDGKKIDSKKIKMERMIEGNTYTLRVESEAGDQVVRGTISIDPGKEPKTIDVMRSEGPDKGKPMLGIYELKGDTQKVCLGPPGKDRPSEFVSKPGSGNVLTIWQRKAP